MQRQNNAWTLCPDGKLHNYIEILNKPGIIDKICVKTSGEKYIEVLNYRKFRVEIIQMGPKKIIQRMETNVHNDVITFANPSPICNKQYVLILGCGANDIAINGGVHQIFTGINFHFYEMTESKSITVFYPEGEYKLHSSHHGITII